MPDVIGLHSDFKIYHEEFFGGMSEVLERETALFNARSRNTMQLRPRRLKGDYEKESFIKLVANLVVRRDINSAADVDDKPMVQGELVGVKLNRRIGPVSNTLDSWRKIAADPQTMSYLLGQQTGVAVAVEYVDRAIAALVGGITNVGAGVLLDYSGTGSMVHVALNGGLAKFGELSGRIICWVMHSKQYHDLVGSVLAANTFETQAIAVQQGTTATLGRPVVVSDSAALTFDNAGTPGYICLGLQEGAVVVEESEEREVVSDLVTGLENLVMRIQGEYAFNVKLKGMAWDIANGGVNPADAAVALSTNWDKAATNDRSTPGIKIITD